jgi:hypothetical protein
MFSNCSSAKDKVRELSAERALDVLYRRLLSTFGIDLGKNLIAERDAFIADVCGRAGDQLCNLALVLAAERAVAVRRIVWGLVACWRHNRLRLAVMRDGNDILRQCTSEPLGFVVHGSRRTTIRLPKGIVDPSVGRFVSDFPLAIVVELFSHVLRGDQLYFLSQIAAAQYEAPDPAACLRCVPFRSTVRAEARDGSAGEQSQ